MKHFYTYKVDYADFLDIERQAPMAGDWGVEVHCSLHANLKSSTRRTAQTLGVCRVPLYTQWTCDGRYPLHKETGLHRFLQHKFAGNSRTQLLVAIRHHKLMNVAEVADAERSADEARKREREE